MDKLKFILYLIEFGTRFDCIFSFNELSMFVLTMKEMNHTLFTFAVVLVFIYCLIFMYDWFLVLQSHVLCLLRFIVTQLLKEMFD